MRLKPDGTRWRAGGEVKGNLANGVGSQHSHTNSEHGVPSITTADAHTSAASSRLNWRSRRFKWTRPFRRKTKSGFCACAITFQTRYTSGKTHSFQITKTSRIKLYREIAAVTCENDKNHMNAVCDEKVGASLLKSRDIGLCSGYHRALKTSANYTILNTFHIRCINL